MFLLVIAILVVLAGAAYAGYKYLGGSEEEIVPFHSTPENSALPPKQ